MAKLGARCAKLGPRWQQVAPKMAHDGFKMAINLGSFGAILVVTWTILGGWGVGGMGAAGK